MPELPEVETMVRGLKPALAGRQLRGLEVHDASLLHGTTVEELEARGRDASLEWVERRGKWVVLGLEPTRGIIVIQPRMTGGFWLVPPQRPEHIRLTFRVDGPHEYVWFCDNRRLGKIGWYPGRPEAHAAFARSHGPDALEITREDLAGRLLRTARGVKPALMDQKVLAGIGNIYADEILHRARLHPEQRACTLKAADAARLHQAIGAVLREAIEAEGSSFDAGYRTVVGLEGGFLAQNAMYGRGGQPCQACGTSIVKTRIAGLIGRPTYFCPSCQLLPRKGRTTRRKDSGRKGV